MYDNNPYYTDGVWGLTKLIEQDDPDACYSFDTFCVWKHEDGRLFYLSDAGCSCPSPFEFVRSIDDLNVLVDTPESIAEFETQLAEWLEWDTNPSNKEPDYIYQKVQMARHLIKMAVFKHFLEKNPQVSSS